MASPVAWCFDFMGWGALSMLESFPFSIVVGVLLGFLSGLGTGGGSLLILWLTFVIGTNPAVARSVNLLFYIPSALIACLFHIKRGGFSIRKVAPAIIAGCICAGLFSVLHTVLDIHILRKFFGGLLIFIGIRELLYRPRKAR